MKVENTALVLRKLDKIPLKKEKRKLHKPTQGGRGSHGARSVLPRHRLFSGGGDGASSRERRTAGETKYGRQK